MARDDLADDVGTPGDRHRAAEGRQFAARDGIDKIAATDCAPLESVRTVEHHLVRTGCAPSSQRRAEQNLHGLLALRPQGMRNDHGRMFASIREGIRSDFPLVHGSGFAWPAVARSTFSHSASAA